MIQKAVNNTDGCDLCRWQRMIQMAVNGADGCE